MNKAIEYSFLEKNEACRRVIIFEEITKILNLNPGVVLQATTILVENPCNIDLFFDLSYAFKGRWLKMIVNHYSS